MAQVEPRPPIAEQSTDGLGEQVHPPRGTRFEQDKRDADVASPQAFYERSIARDDVRQLLTRLAEL